MTTDALTKEVSLTPLAAEKAKQMLVKRGTPDAAIRLGAITSGCSGMSYKIEYSDHVEEGDQLFECYGVKLVVDSKSMLYLAGTVIDFVSEQFRSGFKFTNPNEKGRCGCGESFAV